MSNYTKQINDAITTRVAAVLTTFSQAAYQLSPEQNGNRNGSTRYAVNPLGAVPAETVHQRITYDQIFELILIDQYINRDGDSDQHSTVLTLFEKMDDVLADLMHTKIGIPAVVMLVYSPTILDPDYPEGEDIIVLRANITVKWRRST